MRCSRVGWGGETCIPASWKACSGSCPYFNREDISDEWPVSTWVLSWRTQMIFINSSSLSPGTPSTHQVKDCRVKGASDAFDTWMLHSASFCLTTNRVNRKKVEWTFTDHQNTCCCMCCWPGHWFSWSWIIKLYQQSAYLHYCPINLNKPYAI